MLPILLKIRLMTTAMAGLKGTELVIGRITDTNSQWLARQTAELGGAVRRITALIDDPVEITGALKDALARGITSMQHPEMRATAADIGRVVETELPEHKAMWQRARV